MYRGDGAFGQFCVVMPEQDAVLAITAGLMEMQPVLDLVWEKILPAMRAEALPGDQTAAQNLAASLSDLKLIPPKGAAASPEAGRISGQTYHFAPNHLQLDSFQLDFTKNVFSYRLAGDGRRRSLHHLEFGIETWVEGADSLHSTLARPNVAPQKVAASGVWVADDTFRLTLCQYESPFIFTLDFRFSGQQVFLDSQVNVDFGPLDAPQLVGTVSC